MGILLANIAAFALPGAAYFSPMAWGGHDAPEIAVWLGNFVFVEGKMRGLFSFLFGASMLLVIERARAAGESPAKVHFSRMVVLLLFGLAHLYLIWWGDILAHYALVGAFAYIFTRLRAELLMAAACVGLALTMFWSGGGLFAMMESAARNSPEQVATWTEFSKGFGIPPREWLLSEIAAMQGAWPQQFAWRGDHEDPIGFLKVVGIETLTAMLFGMWAYKSGFITGAWERHSYRRIAIIGLGLAWTAYLLLGLNTIAQGFDQRWVFFASIV